MKIEAKINSGVINLFIGGGFVDSSNGVDVADAQKFISDYAHDSGSINLEGADIYIDGESWTVNDGEWVQCDDDGFPSDR